LQDSLIALDTVKIDALMEKCVEQGVLIGRGGPSGSVLRIKPPMCLQQTDVDFAIDVLDKSFAQIMQMK
jgi:alanine-glyoxylate transaminase/(R)-3-amino-2-methylpropionate-pyruvate transaminase